MASDTVANVDFCIPTYNRESYVKLLLESLPEEASAYLQDNGAFLKDVKFDFKGGLSVVSEKTIVPMFENWEKASSLGNGEWFFLVSDDDLYYENLKEELAKVLSTSPDVGMVVFGHNVIDLNGNIINSWRPSKTEIRYGKDAFHPFSYGVEARMPSILINRKCFQAVGGIFTDFIISAADSELVQRLSIKYPVMFVSEIISGYRIWPGAATQEKISSKEWRADINLWMKKLEHNLSEVSWAQSLFWRRHIQDDICLQNINGGLAKITGFYNGMKYLFSERYPIFSRPKTHFWVFISLLRCALK